MEVSADRPRPASHKVGDLGRRVLLVVGKEHRRSLPRRQIHDNVEDLVVVRFEVATTQSSDRPPLTRCRTVPHPGFIKHRLHQIRLWVVDPRQAAVTLQHFGDSRRDQIPRVRDTDKGGGIAHEIQADFCVHLFVIHMTTMPQTRPALHANMKISYDRT